jgi:23S rRNA (adenine2503-C2)-methyltransferase
MVLKNLCGLTADEIYDLIKAFGFTYTHALSISNSIYKKRQREISEFGKIPKKLKKELSLIVQPGLFNYKTSELSADNSVKYLFQTESSKNFEAVYLPDGKRHTVCVSTQSGCRMGCPFCVSGRYGFHGNLSAGEIINQILSIPSAEKITHVVFMGMGEPMDNYENVLKAANILTSQWGLALSSKNVTVSTVGIKPGIEKFLAESGCNLTLSLHSPFPEERQKFVPAEKKYPFYDLINLMKITKMKKGRRLSVAYVMISGVNDSDEHLAELTAILKGSGIRVNLLPYHNTNNEAMNSSSPAKMNYFKHNLVISGISASVRKTRGEDISAACGLLAANLR